MRVLLVLLLIALAGCKTLTPYQRISRAIHTTPPHIWCWQKAGQPISAKDVCAPLADVEESDCWADLVSAGRGEDSITGDDLVQCMRSKGWILYPVAFAPKTERIKTCKDSYPAEQCPEELP